ncbi:S8 family peptidase [Paenibacillus flagellatus]|uniref:Peptidase S8 n=1 Tax=Paenibacillus flagellatus TaxID=2211139 RepID=A0A2V5L0W4_9BACL|nr:S8 family peptidase [Paenibacillus flagellatus]PYI56276.1 peptidase S8 [Paenibacillus flagellatus]
MLKAAFKDWIGDGAVMMDRLLRDELQSLYRPRRWAPRWLNGWLHNRAEKRKRIPVIVEFHDHEDSYRDGMQQLKTHMNGHKRCRLKHEYAGIRSCAAELTAEAMKSLIAPDCQSRIKKLHFDRPVRALLDSARAAIRADDLTRFGLTGSGIRIAVLDTGVYPHPDLTQPTNRIAAFRDFVRGRTVPYDDNGHGTHCAGDAAGSGRLSDGAYRGTAPGADIVGVKVLDRNGSGALSTIIAGVEWCVANKAALNIRVMSLSLGSPAYGPAQDDPLVRAVENAWRAGIVVCAAAGNEGPDRGTISSPGTSPLVITVGAMNDHNTAERTGDSVAPFSSRGPTPDGIVKPDLLVPGVNIVSLRSPGSSIDRAEPGARVGSAYFSLSGTSMATPICAGIAALLLQRNPALTPDEVKRELLEGAENWGLSPYVQGEGYLDARKALDM